MNYKHFLVNLILILFCQSAWATRVGELGKNQLIVDRIDGKMPAEFTVVATTITRVAQSDEKKEEKVTGSNVANEINVDNAEIAGARFGRVPMDYTTDVTTSNPNYKTYATINQMITVPEQKFSIQTQIPETLAKVASSSPDPRYAAAGTLGGLVLREGINLLGSELNKAYGKDPYTLRYVSIMPTNYYRIEGDKVVETEEFKKQLPIYKKILEDLQPAMIEYNKEAKAYNTLSAKLRQKALNGDLDAQDALEAAQEKVRTIIKEKLLPLFVQLETMALYRFVIMPGVEVGSSCPSGSGPYDIRVFVYLGTQQINKYRFQYCVSDRSKTQSFSIKLFPNVIDVKQGNVLFQQGGMQLVSGSNMQFVNGNDFTAKETPKFKWTDEMDIKKDASVTDFLFPFDLVDMKNKLDKLEDEKQIAESKQLNEMLTSALAQVKEAGGWFKASDEKKEEILKKEVKKEEKEADDAKPVAAAEPKPEPQPIEQNSGSKLDELIKVLVEKQKKLFPAGKVLDRKAIISSDDSKEWNTNLGQIYKFAKKNSSEYAHLKPVIDGIVDDFAQVNRTLISTANQAISQVLQVGKKFANIQTAFDTLKQLKITLNSLSNKLINEKDLSKVKAVLEILSQLLEAFTSINNNLINELEPLVKPQ